MLDFQEPDLVNSGVNTKVLAFVPQLWVSSTQPHVYESLRLLSLGKDLQNLALTFLYHFL